MMHTVARTLLFGTLTLLSFGLLAPVPGHGALRADSAPTARVVYLARDLTDEALVTLTTTVEGGARPGVVLLDSDKLSTYTRAFLAAYRPDQVVPIGSFPGGLAALERRLDATAAPVIPWTQGPPLALWRSLFPRADRVVVCPAEPRGQLLQAACLAGTARAPLFVFHDRDEEKDLLRDLLGEWHTRQVYLVGQAQKLAGTLPEVRVVHLAGEEAVAAAHRLQLARGGHVQALVVANPADGQAVKEEGGQPLPRMSLLAPWVALRKRAALVLTNDKGTDADERVRAALRHEALRRADALIFVADLQSVPMQQRPNPIPADKDPQIDMEPLTPSGTQPFSFATGRLFHEDLAVVPLLLARQQLLRAARGPRKALVASNAGGGLALLETFSRNTAQELRNAGYETTALFGKEVSADDLRRLLVGQDVFLWEGHHNTLIRDYEFPTWDEPLPPTFVFLQSCLALKDYKVQPLLSRGAVGVVGSSTRTYSASGGACSLAFFDALLYEDQTLGGSLRQAKNFLLAYSLLKEKRLGKDAQRSGADLRSAWAFTLWGDPTLKLPRPEAREGALPPVRHEVTGNTIVLQLPAEKHERVATEKYRAQVPANARLAGLVRKEKDEEGQPLVPFVFAEVHLPQARPGQAPQLTGRLPSSHWVFCWDERRRCGYLLVTPRSRDEKELRFHVRWQPTQPAQPAEGGTAGE